MRTPSAVLFAVGLGLLAGGCGTPGPANAAPDRAAAADNVTIGVERDGGHVPLRLGQTLTVRLEGDPGAGYGWVVKEVDNQILAPDGAVSFTPSAAPRPGAAGLFSARFRSARRGETWLRLSYRRPFEPATPAAAAFAVHVMVT